MLSNEFGDLDLFKLTYEDDEDSYEMMAELRLGYGCGWFNRRGGGGEDKMADARFFNTFEEDFDDQDLA
nr:hypothetical protein [Tanacetum cinerariifolium]